jgi:uncharacterized damage-inducible protein DinB
MIFAIPSPLSPERSFMAKKKNKRTPGKKVVRKSQSKKTAKKSGSASAAHAAGEVARGVALLRWVHDMTGKLCAGFSEPQMLAQPAATDNHLLWQLGHMASSYAWFAKLLDGKPATLGETYDKLFGSGSKPLADRAMYPAHAEIRRVHDEQYNRLVMAAAKMTDEDGLGPTAADAHGFATSKLDALYKCIWHEGWHQGQISSLRRSLGFPTVMM